MSETSYQHLQARLERGVLVLTLTVPRIQDTEAAELLRRELHRALDDFAAQKVVVDFRNLTEISSMAFRPLIGLRRSLQDRGGRMVLCGLVSPVREIFEVTKLIGQRGELTAVFEVEPDVEQAVARLEGPG